MDKELNSEAEREIEALVKEYAPLISRLASRYDVSGLGLAREDLELEGMMGLLRAAQTWLPGKGASFATYAGKCISNAVSSAFAAAARDKHSPLNTGLSLDESDAAVSGDSPESRADALELRSALLSFVEAELSALERAALTLHLAGFGGAEAALRLGKTRRAIDNALARARKKISKKAAELNRDSL